MKYLLLVGLLACSAATVPAQPVNDVQGFRDIKFGTSLEQLPIEQRTKKTQFEGDIEVFTVKGDDLAEKTIFGQPIEVITLSYWDNKLWRISVESKAVPPKVEDREGGMVFYDYTDAAVIYTELYQALKALYKQPTQQKINFDSGFSSAKWDGSTVSVALYASRESSYSGNTRLGPAVSKFVIDMISVPLQTMREAAREAARSSETKKRKDGL